MTNKKMKFITFGSALLAAAMISQLAAFADTGNPVTVEQGGGDCLSSYCNPGSACSAYPGYSCTCQGATAPKGTGSNPGGQGTCM